MANETLQINRAPVLTLWATVVAERLGHDRGAALSLGKAVAGLTAHAKAKILGIHPASEPVEGRKKVTTGAAPREFWISVCGRPVPAMKMPEGIRALTKEKTIAPASVQKYLEGAFGDALDEVEAAMRELAASFPLSELESKAWGLYEKFRPVIASGTRGWGQKGELDLGLVRSLARKG